MNTMVVVLAGRRIDAPGASPPRFPLENLQLVKSRLINFLDEIQPDELICSGACGADLAAMEVAGELNIARRMILPFDIATFRKTSVMDRPGDWGTVYDSTVAELKNSNRLEILNYKPDEPGVYEKTNLELLNRAEKTTSDLLHQLRINGNPTERITAVIVWAGLPKSESDTTLHFMNEAQKRNLLVKEIFTT